MKSLPPIRFLVGAVLALALPLCAIAADDPPPLKVHMLGVGEYKPVESLTAYKKLLESQFRVDVTTSFGKDGKSLPNLEPLKTADVMVIFIRRTNLPEEQISMIREHWEKGKPIVALRTASHGFQQADIEAFAKVIGGMYTGNGEGKIPLRALPVEAQKDHPIMKGVGPYNTRGPFFFQKLAEDAVVLQVVESDKKNKTPMSWVHTYKGGRMFYTFMGVPEDFQNETFCRLISNAIFWTAQRDPDKFRQPANESK